MKEALNTRRKIAFLYRNNADIRSKANRALFLCEGFRNGSWNYELTGSYTINKSVGVFCFKSRAGQTSDLQPKATNTFHPVAIHTNLQENQGLLSKYCTMRAGSDEEVVSIRISQQLV
uniref:Uncharacterized protein n=1 Tax=Populus alba TaxID=43335 RepID=A0A4U5Q7L4_POPAL|nr:hypothetical protein D5086_0000125940 [Populus alba]